MGTVSGTMPQERIAGIELASGFESLLGFFIDPHKVAVDLDGINARGRAKFEDNNAIPFIFNALNAKLRGLIFCVEPINGVGESSPVYACMKRQVEGFEGAMEELGKFFWQKFPRARTAILVISLEVDKAAPQNFSLHQILHVQRLLLKVKSLIQCKVFNCLIWRVVKFSKQNSIRTTTQCHVTACLRECT